MTTMKKYQKPEIKTLVVRTVEMLCASGAEADPRVPYTPEKSFGDEIWIG